MWGHVFSFNEYACPFGKKNEECYLKQRRIKYIALFDHYCLEKVVHLRCKLFFQYSVLKKRIPL